MSSEQSIWERFGRAILEARDDDPPRLVFAAVLDEEGDGDVRPLREKATFIRHSSSQRASTLDTPND